MKKSVVGIISGLILVFGFGFAMMNITMDGAAGFTVFPIVMFFIVISIIIPILKNVKSNSGADSNHQYYNDRQGFDSGTEKVTCVNCNKLIDKSANYCPSCGASQKNTVICQFCGHENPKSNALCEKCNGFL